MQKIILLSLTVILSSFVFAQTTPPSFPTEATDVTAVQIQEFIDNLPRDRVSDRPIRVVETTGDMRLGVFGVYRPMGVTGDVNVHLVDTTEIYYMLKGSATLVTGGDLVDSYPAPGSDNWIRAKGIENGVTRKVVPGDVIVIPGHTPHWWSELDSEIEYLIFRPDPGNRLELK
jgi:mannose-6-phosphate isomerase-like protein (cupin superfamily)